MYIQLYSHLYNYWTITRVKQLGICLLKKYYYTNEHHNKELYKAYLYFPL